MTILNPTQQKHNVRFLVYLSLVVFLGGMLLVFEYNAVASFRAEERKLERAIETASVKNAELKNELYSATDARRLEEVALSSGLVLERNPRYLTSH